MKRNGERKGAQNEILRAVNNRSFLLVRYICKRTGAVTSQRVRCFCKARWNRFAKVGFKCKENPPLNRKGGVESQRKGWGIIANEVGSKRKEKIKEAKRQPKPSSCYRYF